jgi:hypothetical protein
MKDFLHKLWSSPLKGSLLALPAIAIGVVVNHLAGASGQVTLPAQTVIDVLLLWGGSLFSVCGVAYSYYQDLEKFKKEHEEEERVDSEHGLMFVRGKRTGGKWIAVCPTCHSPADTTTGLLRCGNKKCGWQVLFPASRLEEVTSKL